MPTPVSKQKARSIVQNRLNDVTPEEHNEKTEIVRERVRAALGRLHKSGTLRTVLSYHASLKRHEVDLSTLESEFSDVHFDYVSFETNAPFPPASYDAILVPLYGFNSQNYRLGHGSGWYDKFLAGQPNAYKIGVGLEAGRIEFTPAGHDIPLDVVIVE